MILLEIVGHLLFVESIVIISSWIVLHFHYLVSVLLMFSIKPQNCQIIIISSLSYSIVRQRWKVFNSGSHRKSSASQSQYPFPLVQSLSGPIHWEFPNESLLAIYLFVIVSFQNIYYLICWNQSCGFGWRLFFCGK